GQRPGLGGGLDRPGGQGGGPLLGPDLVDPGQPVQERPQGDAGAGDLRQRWGGDGHVRESMRRARRGAAPGAAPGGSTRRSGRWAEGRRKACCQLLATALVLQNAFSVITWFTVDAGLTPGTSVPGRGRSEEHTSELQSREILVCRL